MALLDPEKLPFDPTKAEYDDEDDSAVVADEPSDEGFGRTASWVKQAFGSLSRRLRD